MHDHSDEVQAFVSSTAGISAATPKGVRVTHYGPDGNSIATTGTAKYADAGENGATVHYESALPGGGVRSRSAIAIDAKGAAVSATTDRLDAKGEVSQKVATDYTGLTLNEAGQPSAGQVVQTATGPGGKKTHSSTMHFANETFAKYEQTLYDAETGAGAGGLSVDYSGVKTLGTRLVGGTLAVTKTRADGTPSAKLQSTLDKYGVPSLLASASYKDNGNDISKTFTSDYSGVTFDARRKVENGKLLVESHDKESGANERFVYSYRAGKVTGVKKLESGVAADIVSVAPYPPSFMSETPGLPGRPPDKTSEIKRPDGTLLERRENWSTKTAQGVTVPAWSRLTGYAPDGKTVVREVDIDFAGATFDSNGVPNGGAVTTTKTEGGVRASTAQVKY